jgi:hypothetical protein
MTDAVDLHLQRHHKELLGNEKKERIGKRLVDVRSSEKVASDVAGHLLRVESTAGALAKCIEALNLGRLSPTSKAKNTEGAWLQDG